MIRIRKIAIHEKQRQRSALPTNKLYADSVEKVLRKYTFEHRHEGNLDLIVLLRSFGEHFMVNQGFKC